jgi:hypothetical protein
MEFQFPSLMEVPQDLPSHVLLQLTHLGGSLLPLRLALLVSKRNYDPLEHLYHRKAL